MDEKIQGNSGRKRVMIEEDLNGDVNEGNRGDEEVWRNAGQIKE